MVCVESAKGIKMDDLIGTSEAGRLLGLSQGYIMRLARLAKIEAYKQDGFWLLRRQFVLEYKEWQEKQKWPPKPLTPKAPNQ